jgi:site-specific DNA-adenine methylase
MTTPAFRHMGGKARLRRWLVEHFPDSGTVYKEPFAGKGNVFFHAFQHLKFQHWNLCDTSTLFLEQLREVDLDLLPESVGKDDFNLWRVRAEAGDPIAIVIEPRITFAGKGYKYGYSGTSGTHVGYSGENYKKVCRTAQQMLLQPSVRIRCQDWTESVGSMTEGFVYLDPPYYGTEATYLNVDHWKLISTLNSAKFDWAISGYRNQLYDSRLEFKCRFEYERNSEIKSSNSGIREPVIETLWTNYEL